MQQRGLIVIDSSVYEIIDKHNNLYFTNSKNELFKVVGDKTIKWGNKNNSSEYNSFIKSNQYLWVLSANGEELSKIDETGNIIVEKFQNISLFNYNKGIILPGNKLFYVSNDNQYFLFVEIPLFVIDFRSE